MAPSWLGRLPGRRRTRRIYLHIGAMKTGTTYLQSLMQANRAPLAAAGYLLPGATWGAQSLAVREVLFDDEDPRLRARTAGKWAALCSEAAAHDGEASVLSMEFLSFADPERAATVVDSLRRRRLEVHVVLTVRDARAAIPTQWQTSCGSGGRVPYPAFVRGVRSVVTGTPARRNRGAQLFERTQGIPRMLDAWVPLVGAGRLHVVTVPPRGSDPTILWHRFAEVIGVDPQVATMLDVPTNPSLGHPSSELLRRINVELGKVPRIDYWPVVKGELGRSILGSRASVEQPVRLNHEGLDVACRWNQTVRRAIRDHGVRVVGDLAELPVDAVDPDAPEALPEPSPEELLAAAATAREGLLRLRSDLLSDSTNPATTAAAPDQEGAMDSEDAVAAAVTELTSLVRECIELRRQGDTDPGTRAVS